MMMMILQIMEDDVIAVFERVIPSNLSSVLTKAYALTAFAKLATRFTTNIK
jgi:hypothetical protein